MKHDFRLLIPNVGRGHKNTIFFKMKINAKSPVVKTYAFESNELSELLWKYEYYISVRRQNVLYIKTPSTVTFDHFLT